MTTIIEKMLEAEIVKLTKSLKANQAALAALRLGQDGHSNSKPKLDGDGKLKTTRVLSPEERQRRSDAMTARWGKRKALEARMGADNALLPPPRTDGHADGLPAAEAIDIGGGVPPATQRVKPDGHAVSSKRAHKK
jgi:hypothetical protein